MASFFSVRCILSWRPFCWGRPGLIRSILMPRRNHQMDRRLRPNRAWGLANGMPLSVRMAAGEKFLECALKYLKCGDFFGGFQSLASQQISASLVRDRQRIAVFVIAQLEFTLEIRAPQCVGARAWLSGVPLALWRRRLRRFTRPCRSRHHMDRADSGWLDHGKLFDQLILDLGAPQVL